MLRGIDLSVKRGTMLALLDSTAQAKQLLFAFLARFSSLMQARRLSRAVTGRRHQMASSSINAVLYGRTS